MLESLRMVLAETVAERLSQNENTDRSSLHLLNTRVLLNAMSQEAGKPVRLIDVPDSIWRQLAATHDSVWFMGVYKESDAGRKSALNYRHQYVTILPDLNDKDVVSSPFAIPAYEPDPRIANGWEEWDLVYRKLHYQFRLNVILDFVPNHVALDHYWVNEHPNFFIHYPETNLDQTPPGFYAINSPGGHEHYIAHGKDPNFDAWLDTLQLNYQNPELQIAMCNQLLSLVEHCDGVRCDMAMLVQAPTFYRTWSWITDRPWPGEFWEKTIPVVKDYASQMGKTFAFFAEAYWDQGLLVDQGFDGIYQKQLYDMLRDHRPVSEIQTILWEIATDNCKHIVFIENHDEERAMDVFGKERSKAMLAILAWSQNTVLMTHHGQEIGATKKLPMQITRAPKIDPDRELSEYYQRLLLLRRQIHGSYYLPNVSPTDEEHARIIAQAYTDTGFTSVLVTNTSDRTATGHLDVDRNAKDVSVRNLSDGCMLDNDEIADVNQYGLYIRLDPYQSQVVNYRSAQG